MKTIKKTLKALSFLFDLHSDTDYVETDHSIRKNANFLSANAWTLVFAIFIASVGLNVNSTAVIIGAMLISPLMGPIVAFGYGLGINDFKLIRVAIRNLLIAVLISLLTSTLYFLISPLSDAQSELLARTAPNFYDVLIAFFGGATGIVAMSRKEKGNAIPGVAIATALMPPLCTAGYGISTRQFDYFFGAFYLFIINSVFISISTYLFVKLLKFKKVQHPDVIQEKRINKWVLIGSALVAIPSLLMAWFLMKEISFKNRANQFIEKEFKFSDVVILEKKIHYTWSSKEIDLTVVGSNIKDSEMDLLKDKMKAYHLDSKELFLKYVSFSDQIKLMLKESPYINDQIALLQVKINQIQEMFKLKNEELNSFDSMTKEISIYNAHFKKVYSTQDGVGVVWKFKPGQSEKLKLEKFIKTRMNRPDLIFLHSTLL